MEGIGFAAKIDVGAKIGSEQMAIERKNGFGAKEWLRNKKTMASWQQKMASEQKLASFRKNRFHSKNLFCGKNGFKDKKSPESNNSPKASFVFLFSS